MNKKPIPAGPALTERSLRSRVRLLVAGLCAALAGCGSQGGMSINPDGGKPDAMGVVPLLQTHPGCPLTLFAEGTMAQDLSSEAAYTASWTGGWAQPKVSNGSLVFGPHPLSMNWWENYSPTTSKQKPGDVLLCARVRMTPEVGGDVADNTFELTMRLPDAAQYETAGMALRIEANAGRTRLHTRTGGDTSVMYALKALANEPGTELTYEILLFGQGSRFVAEVKNTKTGQVVIMPATAELPAGGAVTMLSWRNRFSTSVDRLVIGQPALSTAARLASEINP